MTLHHFQISTKLKSNTYCWSVLCVQTGFSQDPANTGVRKKRVIAEISCISLAFSSRIFAKCYFFNYIWILNKTFDLWYIHTKIHKEFSAARTLKEKWHQCWERKETVHASSWLNSHVGYKISKYQDDDEWVSTVFGCRECHPNLFPASPQQLPYRHVSP